METAMTLVSVPIKQCSDDCKCVTNRVVRRISDKAFDGDAKMEVLNLLNSKRKSLATPDI